MREFSASALAGRVVVVTGHFGCGKTNVSAELAKRLSSYGQTYLIDYDNVNPYFRAADTARFLEPYGVKVVIPEFANTNVDIPAVSPLVNTALTDAQNGASVVIDVGGDMLGAISLGYLHEKLLRLDPVVLYVFNAYRPLTGEWQDALTVMKEIEAACGLTVTALVNNSNIGAETTSADIEATAGYAKSLSDAAGAGLLFTSYMNNDPPNVPGDILKLKDTTKKLF